MALVPAPRAPGPEG